MIALPPSELGGCQLNFMELVVTSVMEGERGAEGQAVCHVKIGYSQVAFQILAKSQVLSGGLVLLFLK